MDARFRKGNSGAPLFTTDPSGRRAIFGLLAAHDNYYGYGTGHPIFTDLSGPRIQAFIEEHAEDKNQSARWIARHGTKWIGQTDYDGPCDTFRDPDCDGWWSSHDNCPSAYNPLQEDDDDDGRGNACDNCPFASNPVQENCNRLVERVHQGRLFGDACDPSPCPLSDLGNAHWVETCRDHANPLKPCDGAAACLCDGRKVTFSVRSTPLGPHTTQVVPNVETSFRFCQSQPARYDREGNERLDFIDCLQRDVINTSQLDAVEPPNPTQEFPWHRITFGSPNPPLLLPARGETRRWDYGRTVETNT